MIVNEEFYKNNIKLLPSGLEKYVAEILLKCKGKDKAIRRTDLVQMVRMRYSGGEVDRQVRKAIEKMRVDGWLIGSSLNGKGYYLIQTPAEYQAFRSEYTSRAFQVLENVAKMDKVAARQRLLNPDAPRQLSLLPNNGFGE